MQLITGANRGIGAALLNAMPGARGTARSPNGDLLRLDVTDPASCTALAKDLDGHPIDLLVCNAGVYTDDGLGFDDLQAAHFTANMAANVTGVFSTVQALLPNLRMAQGKIAIIASQMGSSTRAKGSGLAYRVSKAAAINLGLNLATLLRPDGIAVGIYHPGWVRTDMGGGQADIDVETSAKGLAAQFVALDLAQTGCFRSYDGTDIPV